MLLAENLLNMKLTRDRTIYAGLRSLSPVLCRELREATTGTRLILSVSGSFKNVKTGTDHGLPVNTVVCPGLWKIATRRFILA